MLLFNCESYHLTYRLKTLLMIRYTTMLTDFGIRGIACYVANECNHKLVSY